MQPTPKLVNFVEVNPSTVQVQHVPGAEKPWRVFIGHQVTELTDAEIVDRFRPAGGRNFLWSEYDAAYQRVKGTPRQRIVRNPRGPRKAKTADNSVPPQPVPQAAPQAAPQPVPAPQPTQAAAQPQPAATPFADPFAS